MVDARPQSQARVLLVDDELIIVKVVSKRLEASGYAVSIAMDGEEALAKVKQLNPPPELIILDLMLPKLNGYEVCRVLKEDARYQHIPIILFSAMARDQDKQRGQACGADSYVTKPFKSETLLGEIERLLN